MSDDVKKVMKVLERKPLSKKQILEKLKEIGDGETKMGFCNNSRRWTLFMMFGEPETCVQRPQENCDDNCGYYESRELTRYVIQKLREMRWGTDEE